MVGCIWKHNLNIKFRINNGLPGLRHEFCIAKCFFLFDLYIISKQSILTLIKDKKFLYISTTYSGRENAGAGNKKCTMNVIEKRSRIKESKELVISISIWYFGTVKSNSDEEYQ